MPRYCIPFRAVSGTTAYALLYQLDKEQIFTVSSISFATDFWGVQLARSHSKSPIMSAPPPSYLRRRDKHANLPDGRVQPGAFAMDPPRVDSDGEEQPPVPMPGRRALVATETAQQQGGAIQPHSPLSHVRHDDDESLIFAGSAVVVDETAEVETREQLRQTQ